jgi:hypothetical protein
MAMKVFISYRREDTRYQAGMIHAAFCKAIPSDHVFMDVDSIALGANFRKILKDWVDQCELLLALIGPGWINARDPKTNIRRLDNKADFVRIEIGEALARGILVVPILVDGAPIPDVDLLPDDLKDLVDRQAEWLEYRTFDADVERIIRKLRLNREGGLPPEPPRPPTGRIHQGNIYLAKVTRVDPSVSAAFVDYGETSLGFLPFLGIHPDYYQIPLAERQPLLDQMSFARSVDEDDRGDSFVPPQFTHSYKIHDVIKRRQVMLVQVDREAYGNRGAHLTTYLRLRGSM